MADAIITKQYLTDIADAIRTKNGQSTTYKPYEMAAAIESIPTSANLGTKSITTNGTYTASTDSLDGYSEVTVDVPSGGGTLGTKTITQNGTYNATDDSLDGYSSVAVNVSGGGNMEEWDFTESDPLVGKLHGYTISSSGVTFDGNGATFGSVSDYISIIPAQTGMTFEIDVSAMSLISGSHGRFLMGPYDKGLIYRSTGVWAFYSGRWVDSTETDGSFFAGSTVKAHIDTSGYWHIYKDGVLWWEPSLALQASSIMIGSTGGSAINDTVITALRIL